MESEQIVEERKVVDIKNKYQRFYNNLKLKICKYI